MGQNQSKYESPKKSRVKLKAPSEWRNDAEFEVISPTSDISNPSQFRGRQINHPQSVPRRDRSSKVCPKQKPSTGIPAPSRFYFQTTESDTTGNENVAPSRDTKTSAWMKSVKDKCSKAKARLADCFIEKDENIIHRRSHDAVKRYQVDETKAARKPPPPKTQAHDDYLQFKPILKESQQTQQIGLTDDVYLQHFMASHSQEESEKNPVPSLKTESSYSTLQGRALSLDSSKNDPSKGPSLHDQSLQSASNRQPIKSRSTADREIFRRTNAGAAAGEPIARTNTTESMRLRASISKTESIDDGDKRRVSVGQQVQEQINQKTRPTRVQRLRQQYQEELERLHAGGTATAANNNNNNNRADGGDRYAVSTEERASSVPKKRVSMEHEKKKAEEFVEHKKGDKQGRAASNPKKRVSVEHEKKMAERGADIKKPENQGRATSNPKKRASMNHEKMTAAQGVIAVKKKESNTQGEDKTIRQSKARRSVSAPRPSLDGSALLHLSGWNAPTTNPSQPAPAQKTVQAAVGVKNVESKRLAEQKPKRQSKGRRSVSAPRPSLDGSALLHLTGWKAPTTKPSQPMPALLKIAGWGNQESQAKRPALTENRHQASRNLVPSKSNNVTAKNGANAAKTKRAKTQSTKSSKDAPVETKISSADQKTSEKDVPETSSKDQKTSKPSKKISNNGQIILRDANTKKKKGKKNARFSNPLPFSRPSDNCNSIATILQHAYFGDLRKDDPEYMIEDIRRMQNLAISKSDSMICSPSTEASGSPKPAFSDEADVNGHFLFQADENNIRIVPTMPSSNHAISTVQSRSRMNIQYQAAEIPPPLSTQAIEDQETRQVRFSGDSKTLKIPGIDSKYSDLTDSTGGRESSDAMSIPRIDSIPEEEEEDDEPSMVAETAVEDSTMPPVNMDRLNSRDANLQDEPTETIDEKQQEFTEDNNTEDLMTIETDHKTEDVPNDEETPKMPISRWSYRRDGSLSTGVTPLIDGRNHANLVTNSPYLRYQEAKQHFNGGKVTKQIVPKKKVSPVKRKSPSKRAVSLVTTRVAAMEAKNGPPLPVRRSSSGPHIPAPRPSNLKNPSLIQTIQTKNLSRAKSPQDSTPMSSVISESSSDDEFGRILHSNAIDEDSGDEHNSPKVSDCDESCDEFDNILKCDESDRDDEESQPSVATLRARFSMESAASSVTEAASVATTLQRRRLLDTMSVVSSTSSVGDTASVTSSIFSKTENMIPSAVQRMRAQNLPFRDVSSVKPNEQSQGTPMQARKWRAYAAAAREKSLSVRNLNMQ